MKYSNIPEEELKNTVAKDFFSHYNCTKILKNIDFSVCVPGDNAIGDQYFLWAEAKAVRTDICDMLAQLVLTIGKAKTHKEYLPPPYLGCFDLQSIAFIPYSDIQDIFFMNDFNWNVAPSDKRTKEFKLIRQKIIEIIYGDGKNPQFPSFGGVDAEGGRGGEGKGELLAKPAEGAWVDSTEGHPVYLFDFEKDDADLRTFIKQNFVLGNASIQKIRIDKNNFVFIYNKWLEKVKPTIMIRWESVKKRGIFDGDFYLADLLSRDNVTLMDKLFVVLQHTKYVMGGDQDEQTQLFDFSIAEFIDDQQSHNEFWAKYERPPLKEYFEYIMLRRDLLVPQDIRERKGSFYTPEKWVELSQKYFADVFGVHWQDDYYVWDCAAGTGNLLIGLSNKYRIFASTIDKTDVAAIRSRIKQGTNLAEQNVFQFDFLNDDFKKLPEGLRNIIATEPEKLIIYINPPYAECGYAPETGKPNKREVSSDNKTHKKYASLLGKASRELFAQFLIRIYKEIPGCKVGNFSTLKSLNAPNFLMFREVFLAKLERLFIVPANTFDNVKGDFPIGFHIWDTAKKERFEKVSADVYGKNGEFLCRKNFYCYDTDINNGKQNKYFNGGEKKRYINDWISTFETTGEYIGALSCKLNDFQHRNRIFIANTKEQISFGHKYLEITRKNLIPACVYLAVRKVIPASWVNDRDQFLYPKDSWQKDIAFQYDCVVYTLFHNSNNITMKAGVNHWIPFTENETLPRGSFVSHYVSETIKRSLLSDTASEVMKAGLTLWRYYHQQKYSNPNASFYDIREHFQGRNASGKMNSTSKDEMYNKLLNELRLAMKLLEEQIEPKIYEHGFLL